MNETNPTIAAVTRANAALESAIKTARRGENFDLKTAIADAKEAWMAELPLLDNPSNVKLYIACVACGMKMRVLSPQEARAMIFIAQTQLTAMRQERGTEKSVRSIYGAAPRKKARFA